MLERALLLTEPAEHDDAGRLERALNFFGISASRSTVAEFLAAGGDSKLKSRLLSTGSAYRELRTALAKRPDGSAFWQNNIHSVFVFGVGNFPATEEFECVPLKPAGEWTITRDLPEFCKVMSGIQASVREKTPKMGFRISQASGNTVGIIVSRADGRNATFIRTIQESVPVFFSSAGIVDIQSPLADRDFDVRSYFFSAIPLVLYIRWAFSATCWQSPETTACLVIDDPLLKPRYGFLKFQRLVELMRQHHFSTSIAFIPWNCRRSSAKVVRLFKENPEQLSLSIHGCDHSGGEFGSRNDGRLVWKCGEALRRMERHESRTGLPHDAVMVFPQGVFSAQSMAVLKHSHFIGAVNSEVVSTDPAPLPIRIEDYWNVAVMNYSDFPIFTRRYPSAGAENFAFDILLGKPCIVVVHHNDCYDDCSHVANFMQRLNELNVPLRWTSLAEVVRRSFRQRELSAGVVEIEMYGSEVRIENPSGTKRTFQFRKRESAEGSIAAVQAGGQPVQWGFRAGEHVVTFEVELAPGENKVVSVTYKPLVAEGFTGESLKYRLKVMARRYLSEVRDNYVTRKPLST